MSCQLYVYYTISPTHGQQVLPMLRQMQAALARQGVEVSLMRRPEENTENGLQTWMEVYRGVVDRQAFLQQLQQALQDHGLETQLNARHLEWFVPLDD